MLSRWLKSGLLLALLLLWLAFLAHGVWSPEWFGHLAFPGFHLFGELSHDLGVGGGNIGGLTDVFAQVIELWLGTGFTTVVDQLPLTLTDTDRALGAVLAPVQGAGRQRCFFPGSKRQEAAAVELPVGWDLIASGFHHTWKDVEGDDGLIDYAAGLDLIRPAHGEWDAGAAFPDGAFLAFERSVVSTECSLAAVVIGIDDDGVILDPCLIDLLENLAYIVIQAEDEAGIVLTFFFSDVLETLEVFWLGLQWSMGCGERNEEVEGPLSLV